MEKNIVEMTVHMKFKQKNIIFVYAKILVS